MMMIIMIVSIVILLIGIAAFAFKFSGDIKTLEEQELDDKDQTDWIIEHKENKKTLDINEL